MVASKPQIQETLTVKILEEIKNRLNPTGIGVVVRAIHTCVFARGVQSNRAEFTTNAMYGKFKTPKLEANFFHVCEHTMLVINTICGILRIPLRSQWSSSIDKEFRTL